MKEFFRKLAKKSADKMGSPWSFALAALIVIVWAFSGHYFGYSDTWQLVINTGTTIVTFLMVFLIQNTQNRDTLAIHLKLDELIRSLKHARNKLIDLDKLSDDELQALHSEFQEICSRRKRRIGPHSESRHGAA